MPGGASRAVLDPPTVEVSRPIVPSKTRASAHPITFDVDPSYVGKIIGRRAKTLQNIKADFRVSIVVMPSGKIIIKDGMPDNMARAKDYILNIIANAKSAETVMIACPNDAMCAWLLHQWRNTDAFKGLDISMKADFDNRSIEIIGQVDVAMAAAERAKAMLTDESPRLRASRRITMPKDLVPAVIGKGGLRMLARQEKFAVLIFPDAKRGVLRVVGTTDEAVDAAVRDIESEFQGELERFRKREAMLRATLDLPKGYASRLQGKGRYKTLRRCEEFGVLIDFDHENNRVDIFAEAQENLDRCVADVKTEIESLRKIDAMHDELLRNVHELEEARLHLDSLLTVEALLSDREGTDDDESAAPAAADGAGLSSALPRPRAAKYAGKPRERKELIQRRFALDVASPALSGVALDTSSAFAATPATQVALPYTGAHFVTKTLNMPHKLIPQFVGRGHRNIDELQQRHTVIIKTAADTGQITIIGKSDTCVKACAEEIEAKFHSEKCKLNEERRQRMSRKISSSVMSLQSLDGASPTSPPTGFGRRATLARHRSSGGSGGDGLDDLQPTRSSDIGATPPSGSFAAATTGSTPTTTGSPRNRARGGRRTDARVSFSPAGEALKPEPKRNSAASPTAPADGRPPAAAGSPTSPSGKSRRRSKPKPPPKLTSAELHALYDGSNPSDAASVREERVLIVGEPKLSVSGDVDTTSAAYNLTAAAIADELVVGGKDAAQLKKREEKFQVCITVLPEVAHEVAATKVAPAQKSSRADAASSTSSGSSSDTDNAPHSDDSSPETPHAAGSDPSSPADSLGATLAPSSIPLVDIPVLIRGRKARDVSACAISIANAVRNEYAKRRKHEDERVALEVIKAAEAERRSHQAAVVVRIPKGAPNRLFQGKDAQKLAKKYTDRLQMLLSTRGSGGTSPRAATSDDFPSSPMIPPLVSITRVAAHADPSGTTSQGHVTGHTVSPSTVHVTPTPGTKPGTHRSKAAIAAAAAAAAVSSSSHLRAGVSGADTSMTSISSMSALLSPGPAAAASGAAVPCVEIIYTKAKRDAEHFVTVYAPTEYESLAQSCAAELRVLLETHGKEPTPSTQLLTAST